MHGADVNKTNPEGQTALMWAVAEKNAAAAKTLIDHGADVNAQTHKLPPPTDVPNDLLGSVPGGRDDGAAVCGAAERSGVARGF